MNSKKVFKKFLKLKVKEIGFVLFCIVISAIIILFLCATTWVFFWLFKIPITVNNIPIGIGIIWIIFLSVFLLPQWIQGNWQKAKELVK